MQMHMKVLMNEVDELVEVEGARIPRGFTVELTYDGVPTTVHVRIAFVSGRFTATNVSFDNPPDSGLRPDFMEGVSRSLPKVVELGVLQWPFAPFLMDGQALAPADPEKFVSAMTTRQRRRDITDEHLAAVAEVYNGAPTKPAKAVEEHWHTSPATASRWVKLAREAGFIKPKGEA